MNRHVNAISGPLSLRPPQRRSLEILVPTLSYEAWKERGCETHHPRLPEMGGASRGLVCQGSKDSLASANFSKELTTAVMWLNKLDLDIRCVRVIPYQDNGRVLIDVQQVIPLPEAGDYQIQIREKEHKGRQERGEHNTRRERFWEELLALANSRTKLHANISPTEYHWIGAGAGVSGLGYNYGIRQHGGTVELYTVAKTLA